MEGLRKVESFTTVQKMLLLSPILRAATLLYDCKLINIAPNDVVKLFLKKNPDIQAAVTRESSTLAEMQPPHA